MAAGVKKDPTIATVDTISWSPPGCCCWRGNNNVKHDNYVNIKICGPATKYTRAGMRRTRDQGRQLGCCGAPCRAEKVPPSNHGCVAVTGRSRANGNKNLQFFVVVCLRFCSASVVCVVYSASKSCIRIASEGS